MYLCFVFLHGFDIKNCSMKKELCQYIGDYRLNRFVVKVDVHDGWMLYNTTTGCVVFIPGAEDLYNLLDKLIEMYYYVPLTFDEVAWVNKLRTERKSSSNNLPINGFTIFTTTDCNANCFYCYENKLLRTTMTDKVAKDVAEFIIRSSSNSRVNIRWFGGEPLVNTNAIDIICITMKNNDVKFKSSMVSNGLLFTDSLILKAKKLWKLKKVQITLDGTKYVYQKTKSYKDAVGNEFERVIDNISKLVEANIRVSIRLNQGLYNISDLIELIDILSSNFRGNRLVSVYNSLLFDEKADPCTNLETERYKLFKKIQEKIIECNLFKGYSLKKRRLRYSQCMADNDSSVIITPKGEIGKCEHFTDQHLIGNIYDTNLDYDEILGCKEQYQPTQKCFECPLYPQCVRIKICPEEKAGCSLIQCENKIELIQKALLKEYKSLQAKNKIVSSDL